MNANREQPIKDFELTGRWRLASASRRFFYLGAQSIQEQHNQIPQISMMVMNAGNN